MHIPRIYYQGSLKTASTIELPSETTHHLANVLRMRAGEQITLFNGEGGEFHCSLVEISKKACHVQIEVFIPDQNERNLNIHLAQSVVRNDRMDLIIQKAVELGTTRFTPLLACFSEKRSDTKFLAKRQQHWQKIMLNACEQSGRTRLMQIEPPCLFGDFLHQADLGLKLILHPYAKLNIASVIKEAQTTTLLIGPEGGWDEDELTQAEKQNCLAVRLSQHILRTETAAIAALAVVQALC
jgi:16S rRNA (uracil1498-N3)-methyltransferase